MRKNIIILLAAIVAVVVLVGCVSNIPVSQSFSILNRTINITIANDTSQFLLLNGSRSMTGDLNMSSNNITRVGYIDKVAQTLDPGTPPAKTLRLYTKYNPETGFSVYKYKDDTGMVRELVRDSMFNVYGGSEDMPALAAVYNCGTDNNVPQVCPAYASRINMMPAIGVSIEPISIGAPGRVMMVGLLEDVDTSMWNEGDVLYVSDITPGLLTSVKPATPGLSQEMGRVLLKDGTSGKIQVITKSLTGNEYGTINDFKVIGNISASNFNSSHLSGIKTYYVANSSGGSNTVKLTFTNGILTGES